QYIPINPLSNFGTFLAGQLGTFRYIDNNVKVGQTYWYRVRATSGDITVNSDGSVTFMPPTTNPITGRNFIAYPGGNPTAMVGRASPIHSATVPMYATAPFDVIGNLIALFETAFSLNFHQPLSPGATFAGSGLPIAPTTDLSIGLGSLTQLAGSLTTFEAMPIVGASAGAGAKASAFSPGPTGALPQAPWQTFQVSSNSTRLAITVAGALLNSNSAPAFQHFMTLAFPRAPTPKGSGAANLSQFVLSFTAVSSDPQTMLGTLTQYGNLFGDPGTRLNVLAGINYVKTFLLGGVPPDWKSIQLLRDIIPWAGQLLYELIAKIQALLAAFQGLMQEIIANPRLYSGGE
ncbi:MAG: hypothetical protein OK454_11750, partial [Thaumarchaeota archaeon]|nr:hypothetical protein [Nitrososphaerota archaeon]